MSEIEKLFEATKPFRDEIAKLYAEVGEGQKEVNRLHVEGVRMEEKLKSTELQNSELISLLCQIEWVTDGYSGVKICPCCEQDKRHNPGCKLDELIHKTNDKRNLPHDHSDSSSPCDMLCMEESGCICPGDGNIAPFCAVHGLPMSGH